MWTPPICPASFLRLEIRYFNKWQSREKNVLASRYMHMFKKLHFKVNIHKLHLNENSTVNLTTNFQFFDIYIYNIKLSHNMLLCNFNFHWSAFHKIKLHLNSRMFPSKECYYLSRILPWRTLLGLTGQLPPKGANKHTFSSWTCPLQ